MSLQAIRERLDALSKPSSPWDGDSVYMDGSELDLWHNAESDIEALLAVAEAAEELVNHFTIPGRRGILNFNHDAWNALRETLARV